MCSFLSKICFVFWIFLVWNGHHGGWGSMLLFHHGKNPATIKQLLKSASTRERPNSPQILPPNLPKRFHNEFIMYYTPRDDDAMPLPPWPTTTPPDLPYAVGRGQTWYAADLGIMVESYTDYCVPIFEPNSYFPCILFNYDHVAYFIAPNNTGYGPCCVYRKPWEPPKRNFMQSFTHFFNGTTQALGQGLLKQTIDWWYIPLDDVRGRDNHPVFGGYGWARQVLESGTRPQVCFWYEGNVGWAQQLFYNFVDTGPRIHDLDHFRLPDICKTDRACLFRP